jgi:hypothetical protein
MNAQTTQERLEELRAAIQAERISYDEIAELQSLAEHIDPSDVELLEWAGVDEHAAITRTAATDNIVCQTCGKKWDTISPCALCNATRPSTGRT